MTMNIGSHPINNSKQSFISQLMTKNNIKSEIAFSRALSLSHYLSKTTGLAVMESPEMLASSRIFKSEAMNSIKNINMKDKKLDPNDGKNLSIHHDPSSNNSISATKDEVEVHPMCKATSLPNTVLGCSQETKLTLEKDPKYSKFFKMLKLGLPRGAVEQKMRIEKLDVSILDMDPSKPLSSSVPITTTDSEVKQLEKYRKMLQMGLSKAAVVHRMCLDKVNPDLLDLGGVIPTSTKFQKSKHNSRKKLHWKVIPENRLLQGNHFWKKTNQQVIEGCSDLNNLFGNHLCSKPLARGPTKISTNGSTRRSSLLYIDMKKAQNIAIVLARSKLSFSQIKNGILQFDEAVLTPNQLQSLIELWPSNEELRELKKYSGDINRLGKAEQFVLEMIDIPSFQKILYCLSYKQNFPVKVKEIRESIQVMEKSINEIRSSVLLKELLHFILVIGNHLNNTGEDVAMNKPVIGYSLDSLGKLVQTKSSDSSTNLLQYIVGTIEMRYPHLLGFQLEIPHLEIVTSVSRSQLEEEYQSLEDGRQRLSQEVQVLFKESIQSEFCQMEKLQDFISIAAVELVALKSELDQMNITMEEFRNFFGEAPDTTVEMMLKCLHQFSKVSYRITIFLKKLNHNLSLDQQQLMDHH